MPTSIESIHKEIVHLRKDVDFIKTVLVEDFELSDHAKKALKDARETPESDYADLE